MGIFYSNSVFYSPVDVLRNVALPFEWLHNCQKTRFALGVQGLAHFHIQVPINKRAWGTAGILLPVLEAESIPELHRGSPRGLASRVVMGTASHKGNPEVTVSESKAKEDEAATSLGQTLAYCPSCNGKILAKERL